MKKINLFFFGVALLALTSCAKDELVSPEMDKSEFESKLKSSDKHQKAVIDYVKG